MPPNPHETYPIQPSMPVSLPPPEPVDITFSIEDRLPTPSILAAPTH